MPKRSHHRSGGAFSHSIDPTIREFFSGEKSSKSESIDEYLRWENSMRMFGISFFPIQYESVEYLGIRLEIFNELTGQFGSPNYIICKPSEKSSNLWELFRHNLPKYVKIAEHWELITGSTNTSDLKLLQFSQQCYKDLLRVQQRIQYFQKLDKQVTSFSLLQIDELGTHVLFRLSDSLFELTITMEDEVVSCRKDSGTGIILLGSMYEISNKLELLV